MKGKLTYEEGRGEEYREALRRPSRRSRKKAVIVLTAVILLVCGGIVAASQPAPQPDIFEIVGLGRFSFPQRKLNFTAMWVLNSTALNITMVNNVVFSADSTFDIYMVELGQNPVIAASATWLNGEAKGSSRTVTVNGITDFSLLYFEAVRR